MKKILLSLVAIATLVNAEMIRIDDKEIVLDTNTHLMWQDNGEAKTVQKNWQDAINYCQNLNLAGYNDWRLPDKYTLKALYPKKDSLRSIAAYAYWSSSPDVSVSSVAWYVNFNNGYDDWDGKSNSYLVRCVRDSKNFETLSFSSFINSIKTNINTNKTIILSTKPVDTESKLFFVEKDGKKYFGTQSEVLKEIGLTKWYSQNPFEGIQKLTQQQLNEYFAIPNIEIPKITKDEFETKKRV